MARERSVRDDCSDISRRDDGSRGSDPLLDRRSYLKLAGTAAATVAAGASTASAASGDYDVIEINPGERRYIHIDSGETWENKLIDVTANNCACTLVARGTDWTIRNVGWTGRSRDHTHIACEETGGGESRIENVYIGDGAEEGHRNGLGVYLHGDHNGHLVFDRVNIQEMGDNSFYCSTATNGEVTFQNCYSKNSWVAHYRVACPSTIENCVAVNTNNGMSQRDGRGVWSWRPGECEVRNSHFAMNGRHYSFVASGNGGGKINVHDTEWDDSYHGGTSTSGAGFGFHSGNGNNPEDFVPEGCPTSAEEAAGAPSDGSEDDHEGETFVRVEGPGAFRVETDGTIEPADSISRWANSEQFGDDWAGFELGDAFTEFWVDGEITSIEADDSVVIEVDEEAIDPGNFPPEDDEGDENDGEEDSPDDGDENEEETFVRVEGPGAFRVETDGSVTPADSISQWVTSEQFGDDWAGFELGDAFTEFHVDGEITSIEADDGVTVIVDGEEVDPGNIPPEDDESDREEETFVRVEGPGAFRVETDGSVTPADSISQWATSDQFGDDWAGFELGDSFTEFHVDGEITSIEADGSVTVIVDGEEVEPDGGSDESFVRVEGPGAFRVETDGSVAPADSISQWATSDQFGDDWAGFELGDAFTEFHVAGAITSVEADSSVTVIVDGEEVDPNSY